MAVVQRTLSRDVQSTQAGPHRNLAAVVHRHLKSAWRRPISEHTRAAFERASDWLAGWQGEIILDSCCGTGESTAKLACRYPHARVIGIDKSAHRLGKHVGTEAGKYLLLRADANDFWRLAKAGDWQPVRHYLFYPNPFPKAAGLTRRWHGSPAFPALIALGGILEVRSNWRIYIEEFASALAIAGVRAALESTTVDDPMSPFERKYAASGHTLWRLVADLDERHGDGC